MDQKNAIKQVIEFNKTAFNNGFTAIALIQDQIEKVTLSAMDQATWLPEEGRKAVQDWADAYKSGREQFKSYVDESYQKVEKYMASI